MTQNSPDDLNFAVCIRNDEYQASLELRKLYRVLEDREACAMGLVRVVDESGESYLYPREFFLHLQLPVAVRDALLLAS